MPSTPTLRIVAVIAALLGAVPCGIGGGLDDGAALAASSASGPDTSSAVPFAARLRRRPLAPPVILNGGFGDYRGGHFHAGFDLGTGRRVGRPVRAPESGWIERVRSSGVGYGRAIYLRAADGRILEFGHLDAFAGALAAYVDGAKDSSGDYEQDLWPARGRFPVHAGDVIAWSGESGAGGPHLHFEVRHGDVAYNPGRAGFPLADLVPPTLLDLTLEPLDDRSRVEGHAGPYMVNFARADTLRAIGRLRAVVGAYDRVTKGGARTAPWSVAIEWNAKRTECRFDSLSWATDMAEAAYVYDAGRVTGKRGFVLWAPPRFRPRVLRSDAPDSEEAGTIEIGPDDPPRTLTVRARDLAGRTSMRRIVLRPEAPPPGASAGWWRGDAAYTGEGIEVVSLPNGFVRLSVPLRAAAPDFEFQFGAEARRVTRGGEAWEATFAVPPSRDGAPARLALAMRGGDRSAAVSERGGLVAWCHADASAPCELLGAGGGLRVSLGSAALFEDATLLAYAVPADSTSALVAVGGGWAVMPSTLPLRRAARIGIVAPVGASLDRIGLYRRDGSRWQYVGAHVDSSSGAVSGESRALGRFALFRDQVPPRATLLRTAAAPARPGPYSRWAVEASADDAGSGIDASASYLKIDGRRVPTEWDPEAGRLRWRPLRPPAAGAHDVVVVAADRAGNTTRAVGKFWGGR
jgi:hypothetical protein